ncbi:MAG: methyl-accepting chemotaxis protein [Leptospiraceae bacterium]|nr:methyl-accepting chemotaxis protein [Leptospiraceae bacterium]MCZ8347234.1 methyl-accepting chemotaxis protein [Leptospiraceae bacterium]
MIYSNQQIKRGKSLKSSFLFFFSVLLILLIFSELFITIKSFINFLDQKKSLHTIQLTSDLMLGTIELSLERSVSQAALHIQDPVNSEFRKLLDRQRDLANPRIQNVIDNTEQTIVKEKLKDIMNRLEKIRSDIDRNLALPLSQRDVSIVNNVHVFFPQVIEDARSVSNLLKGVHINLDKDIQALESLQAFAWEAREYGGRERTYLAIAVYNRSEFDSEILGRMETLDSHTLYAKRMIDSLFSINTYSEDLIEDYKKMNTLYFSDYYNRKEELKNQIKKREFKENFSNFFQYSSDALDSIVQLVQSSAEELVPVQEQVVRNAFIQFSVSLIVTIVAVGIGYFSIRYSTKTLIDRITEASQVLKKLASGEKSNDVNISGVLAIEIADLIEAAQTFRKNMLELEDLISDQSAAVNQTTTTMISLEKSSRRTAEDAQEGVKKSQTALNIAEDGAIMGDKMNQVQAQVEKVVDEMAQKIDLLVEQTGDISTIVSLVGELANQTNMLALNAAVEAARAGEFGKGFSVVASEIRKLADESKNSASRIQSILLEFKSSSQEAIQLSRKGKQFVDEGSTIVNYTTAKFKEVSLTSRFVSETIETIALNLKEQSRAYGEITLAMNSLNDKTNRFINNK